MPVFMRRRPDCSSLKRSVGVLKPNTKLAKTEDEPRYSPVRGRLGVTTFRQKSVENGGGPELVADGVWTLVSNEVGVLVVTDTSVDVDKIEVVEVKEILGVVLGLELAVVKLAIDRLEVDATEVESGSDTDEVRSNTGLTLGGV